MAATNKRRTVAYLRVSTEKQEIEKNKADIRKLADKKQFGMPEWIEEVASSRVKWTDRKIGEVIAELDKGDRILVSEMSRLGRSMLEIMTILNTCLDKGIEVHAVKGDWSLNGSIQSKVVAMAFSMAAEIERDLISKRTREVLKARRDAGVRLGRPPGPGKSKLDNYQPEIEALLANGSSQSFIAKRYNVTEATVSRWLKKHGIDRDALIHASLKQGIADPIG